MAVVAGGRRTADGGTAQRIARTRIRTPTYAASFLNYARVPYALGSP
jgi:hypothetical protein